MRTAAAIAAAALTALGAWVAQAHISTDLRTAFEAVILAVQGYLVPASIRTVHTAPSGG